jgi:hypothetical protein
MSISFRRSVSPGSCLFVPALLLCLVSLPASQAFGQDSAAQTPLDKQLARIDFAISAAGILNDTVSGIEQRDAHDATPTVLTIKGSNTVGEIATIRYTAKPYVGFEFNFGNSRFTQNYTFVPTPPNTPTSTLLAGGAQAGVHELTLGYIAHLKFRPFGVTPFLGAGGGTMRFKPTTYGGQGLPFQYRAVYYYTAGLEDNFPNSHFGVRLAFRQLIYLAPDFQQNYLTITRRVRTTDPTVGFFVRF